MENKMEKFEKTEDIFNRIARLIEQARKRVATTINEEIVLLYWNIGKAIKEEIIKSDRAEYGKQIVPALSGEFKKLSWTHIRTLLPIKDKLKRQFYATLCLKEQWSTRILQDRINTMLYERTALSKLPEKTIENQLKELKEKDKMTPEFVFRDPYVLDFLELHDTYSEKDLEQAILNALEIFRKIRNGRRRKSTHWCYSLYRKRQRAD